MDNDQKVEVQCESCKNDFFISTQEYENIIDAQDIFLCPDCKLEPIEIIQPCRCFEYRTGSLSLKAMNKLGSEGWNLVTIYNGKAYYKREILK